ncbi:hypothetical protein BZA77DRAFT_307477 [Pyronema omphalodes]|nr:hypothetical protein BZA77DRAFT_307477 [Pyronema omphalodes]
MSSQIVPRKPSIPSKHHGVHPVLRAYGIGALSYLTPRLLGIILATIRRHKKNTHAGGQWKEAKEGKAHRSTGGDLLKLLRDAVKIHRFPAFCGFTVALFYGLEPLLKQQVRSRYTPKFLQSPQAATFIAGTLAGAGGLKLLNCRQKGYGGRTVDLTLFTLVRAVDIVVGQLWANHKSRRQSSGKFTTFESLIGHLADPLVFAISAGCVMHGWFYTPEKLPPSYNRQLITLADVDERLIMALRRIYYGEFIYGVENGQAPLLGEYAKDLNLPYEWGDPVKHIPIPCAVVHGRMFTSNCEVNAIRRFLNGAFKIAFPIYLGLNSIRFIRPKKPTIFELVTALRSTLRSSTFLGLFILIFYYSICLARNRIGPYFIKNITNRENLGIKLGCILCGWSILVETAKRRTEFAFFVAPRALALVVPRKWDMKWDWVEQMVFALSSGVLLTALRHNPKRVRGVYGRLLGKIIN